MNRELSKLLKEKRCERDMSLRDFSSYLGISHAYLSKLEKGIDPRTGKSIIPTIETINKIADGLNIERSEFYNLCGYTKNIDTEQVANNGATDLKKYFAEMIAPLIDDAAKFEFDGKILEKKELRMISEALEIGFTLALKNVRSTR